MSRSYRTFALLLVVGAITACADGRSPAPTAITDRHVALDREPDASDQPTIVRGTGDPGIDVAAVQAAVDEGGVVILKGHFSFDAPPSTSISPDITPLGLPSQAEVKITKAVSISGAEGEGEGADMAVIDGGTIPFYVEAPGQSVSIRRLRFVQPTSHAILVFAVRGLEIVSTKIEGLKPFSQTLNGGIGVFTVGAIPNATKPGKPSNVTGSLVIAGNDIDVAGGTNSQNVLGVTVFSAGDSVSPLEVLISGNRISNMTEPGINFRRVVGHVSIDHNVLNTGTVGVNGARVQVIRVANLGTYVIEHNVINCAWAGVTDAEGIGVFSQLSAWPIENARVEHNRITMSSPEGTTFDTFSAAIGLYGFANNNLVTHNILRGSARAGIVTPVFPLPPQAPATPHDNVVTHNNFKRFMATVGNVVVD